MHGNQRKQDGEAAGGNNISGGMSSRDRDDDHALDGAQKSSRRDTSAFDTSFRFPKIENSIDAAPVSLQDEEKIVLAHQQKEIQQQQADDATSDFFLEGSVFEEETLRDGFLHGQELPSFRHRQVSLSGDEFEDENESSQSVSTIYEDEDELSYESQPSYESDQGAEEEEQVQQDLHSSVIAIGILAPPTNEHDQEEEFEYQDEQEDEPRSTRFKTREEVDHEAVSEAIALGMAETEYARKHKAKDTSKHKMVARRAMSSREATSSQEEYQDTKRPAASLRKLEHVPRKHEQDDRSSWGALDAAAKPNAVHGESSIYGTRRTREGLIEEDDDEEEDLEAQAGIPVVVPGAFAMEGMDAFPGRQVTGYDSGFDNSDSESEDDIERPLPRRLSSAPPVEPEAPPMEAVEGELHQEPQLIDGLALMEDEVPPEEIKVPVKVRLMQLAIFVGALAAIVVIVGLVVGLSGPSSGDTSDGTLVGWEAVGEPLRATQLDKDGSFFGSAVSLSANGARLAVASPGWDESPRRLDIGQMLVYDWNDRNWELAGQELIGPGPKTTPSGSFSLSQTVALSKDGSRVAFGSPDWNGGQVAILQEPNVEEDQWTLVGQNLTGREEENSRFGYSVAMSSTGGTVVVGAPFASNGNNVSAAGVVRVFQETKDASWEQLGQDMMGEGSFDLNGWSVALSSDASRLATGSPGSGVVGNFTGAVRAFRLDGSVWTQLGATLRGESIQDKFGHSVSLSDDGTVLAVGGWEKPDRNTGGIFVGHVRVYRYEDNSNDWTQLGSELVGSASYDNFGYSVALSANGMKLAVGSPRTNSISGGTPPRGHIDIYTFDGGDWRKQGGMISSTQDFDNLGHSVSISADTSRVAGGSPAAGYDGKYNNVGKVGIVQPAI